MVTENRKMVFVVGNSRSGTTMMGDILGNNKNIFTFGELHFYSMLFDPKKDAKTELTYVEAIQLFAKLLCLQRQGFYSPCKTLDIYQNEAESVLDRSTIYNYEKVYWTFLLYETERNGKTISCEQTPKNIFFLNNIFKLPSDIKVINMVRDPRDILNSQKNKWKRRFLGSKTIPIHEIIRTWFNYHPITIALVWRSAINKYTKQPIDNSTNMILVYFEKLLSSPETEVQRICQFLSINYDPTMLDIPQVNSSEEKDSQKKGINKKRINPWKNSKNLTETEIYLCEKYCAREMQEMGYELSHITPNRFLLLTYYVLFPFQMGIALLLNIKRMKNMLAMIKTYIMKG